MVKSDKCICVSQLLGAPSGPSPGCAQSIGNEALVLVLSRCSCLGFVCGLPTFRRGRNTLKDMDREKAQKRQKQRELTQRE